jgi:small conductance mechanosensitive channel
MQPASTGAPGSTGATTGATGHTGSTGTTGASGDTGSILVRANDAADKTVGYLQKYGPSVLSVLIILVVSWFLSSWARRTVRRGLDRAHFDLTLSKFLSNMVRWVILAVAGIACLEKFGYNVTSFAALIGAAGLAIGLGFQGSLSNLAAGVMLLVFRPFKVGDGIAVGGQAGTVNEIDLFTTTLDTADGRRIIMPNGPIFSSVIENMTYHPRRRVDVPITVPGGADIEAVRTMLVNAAKTVSGVLADPPPDAVINDMAGNWTVLAWAATGQTGAVRQGVIGALRKAMATSGFVGSRPSMDVTITGVPEGLTLLAPAQPTAVAKSTVTPGASAG